MQTFSKYTYKNVIKKENSQKSSKSTYYANKNKPAKHCTLRKYQTFQYFEFLNE